MSLKIGFIGAGKMAQALARGFINSGRYPAEQLMASCPRTDVAMIEQFKKMGVKMTSDNTQIVRENEVIILSVKPMQIAKVTPEIAPHFKQSHLLVSLALGIRLLSIEQLLPSNSRVVRAMPNTPAFVGAGVTAYSMGSACQDGDSNLVHNLFSTVGHSFETPEIQMDAIGALSGSGPSYVFSIIEGLADGGVKMGLSRQLSIKLAAMTLHGAAKMVLETDEHPAILKEAVQSPGGSTIRGMHELEKGRMRSSLINAVEAAAKRSLEMGEAALLAGGRRK
ncbi:hypothetical protein niasHS_000984 [Heterodera schachtii]|uniref:Pyrroline-5-carboxylate reductase n=1 Tax=Heterodera schachtii TaxID=97005 RepID=A0ABD2K7Y3_HETSC